MEQREQIEKEIAQKITRKSALIYLPISIGAGFFFFLIATVTGSFPLVARIGGAVWVGLLSLIVSMPTVIPRVKKRSLGRQ